MRLSRYLIVPFLFSVIAVWAQPGALDLGQLMDVPVARTLAQGEFTAELRIYPNGGLLSSILIGLTDRFGLGVSYGGENIIGIGKPNMNPRPCVHVQYLIFDEQFLSPSVVIGFQSQGYGGFNKTFQRFAVKSKGFYAVASKNTAFLGGLGLHVGANYSFEYEDGDENVNAFIGCHKWINPELVVMCEYDAAINDNSDNAIGSGKGYLNAGVRWSFVQRFFIEFSWKNILENRDNVPGSSREVKLIYLAHL
ncbi:hypothetical protein HQ585_13225 [candidate division KSB1 bacterium]|nr:hypothetical protein [candidate division KSB1 bacterium]